MPEALEHDCVGATGACWPQRYRDGLLVSDALQKFRKSSVVYEKSLGDFEDPLLVSLVRVHIPPSANLYHLTSPDMFASGVLPCRMYLWLYYVLD